MQKEPATESSRADKLDQFFSTGQQQASATLPETPSTAVHPFLSDEKLNNIVNFLTEVDTASKLADFDRHMTQLLGDAPMPPLGSDIVGNGTGAGGGDTGVAGAVSALLGARGGDAGNVLEKQQLEQLERAAQTAGAVTQTVLTQRLELEQKTRALQFLQQALTHQRELTVCLNLGFLCIFN